MTENICSSGCVCTLGILQAGTGLNGLRNLSGHLASRRAPGCGSGTWAPTPEPRLVFSPPHLPCRPHTAQLLCSAKSAHPGGISPQVPVPRGLLSCACFSRGVSCSWVAGQRVTVSLEDNRFMKLNINELIAGHLRGQATTGHGAR